MTMSVKRFILATFRAGVAWMLLGVVATVPASAAEIVPGPGWEVNSHTYPTNMAPGSSGIVAVDVYNAGAGASAPGMTITDVLPPGLTGVSAHGWNCTTASVSVCTYENGNRVPAGTRTEFTLEVDLESGATEGSFPNQVTVTGPGAPSPASASNPITISSKPAGFGFAGADAWLTNADGSVDTQAGSHPYELTFNFSLNATRETQPVDHEEARNLVVNLPPGLIGNPTVLSQCTRQEFDSENGCPPSTQIGVAEAGLGGNTSSPTTFTFSVHNLVPPPGEPAQFGFIVFGIPVFLDATVRSGGDYGISEHVANIPQRELVTSSVTIWGVPSDPSHDVQRCASDGVEELPPRCGLSSSVAYQPLLTLPTSCAGPQRFSASADTWSDPNTIAEVSFLTHDSSGAPTGFTGCDHLGFGPSITVAPDTSFADTPAGLTAELKVPQVGLLAPAGLATSNIKDTLVTLPEGVVINPGRAAGLAACQLSEDGVGTEGPPACPSASRIGTDEISTPLLPHDLKGNLYILQSSPPQLKVLVAASGEGVNLKLVGDVSLDPLTGRLTTTFTETPELPFTSFKLSFDGGAQAALITPSTCGTYTTNTDFTPWSTSLFQDVFTQSGFAISAGPGGGACASPLPFSPTLIAGSSTDQAGGYTSFSLLLQRGDGQQRISTLQFRTPEGLLGMISKVPLCGEPQAAQGACSGASQIGHTVVQAGAGAYPLEVPAAGQPAAPIYLTGGYKGAPYGLSIAVPVIAGPFNLGTVVVRASIAVDPHTAQLTITTDPLPSILDGIPTDLRTINAVVDRPGFMFNPTNCSPQSFSGTATSTEGTVAPLSSHFQMGSCQSLKFAPSFKVSTAGRTSRKNGASLDAKILYPTGPLGANRASQQANVASVKVDLPKQLPARLTTLQKACVAAVFEANPANCPKASIVGHATAVSPVLPVALNGPAYFVSHGGEAFPSLIVVLQGYGVTVDLVGTTFINSKTSITSSTFKQVPDVPITSFDLNLPEGPNSALAANLPSKAKGSFCGQALVMPTAFTAQNGAVIHQSTKIAVTGCPKAKRAAKGSRSAGSAHRSVGRQR